MKKNWYDNLEIIDSESVCAIIQSVRIVKKLFLRQSVEVDIEESHIVENYDLDTARDGVLEFLSIYPEIYESSGNFEQIADRINRAKSMKQIFDALIG